MPAPKTPLFWCARAHPHQYISRVPPPPPPPPPPRDLGATPDGRYTCDCHGEGIVEVKCPYKYKDADPEDLLGNADVMVDRNLNINQSHKHYAQVQLQMKLCQVSVCDLVIWTTQGYLNLLIDFDQEFCDDMTKKAQAFFMRAVLPSIISSTHKSSTHKILYGPVILFLPGARVWQHDRM